MRDCCIGTLTVIRNFCAQVNVPTNAFRDGGKIFRQCCMMNLEVRIDKFLFKKLSCADIFAKLFY